jgi:unsaturated rhamnogalacturonyl hydrolase
MMTKFNLKSNRPQNNPSVKLAVLLAIMIIFNACKARNVNSSTTSPSPESVYTIMKKVADWQLDSISRKGWRHPERDWTNGALYAGLLKFAELANRPSYYAFMQEKVGKKFDWQLFKTDMRYHADFYCVGLMYSRMYSLYKDPNMIADFKLLADTLIARPHAESLENKNRVDKREWSWCDALFMAPPALAALSKATGEIKYLDICDQLWWKTSNYLYDKEESLFYRDSRYFKYKEKNGSKVFWSRGNGWVMGGLVGVLERMPTDYPTRPRWNQQFKEMAKKIASLQQPDGTWHASLLDPANFPVKETSGTGFYCYALAWGINNGLLDAQTYTPVTLKAWQALTACVHPDGKLGFVQKIGDSPATVGYEDTEVYGVGAFLLAGSEILKLSMQQKNFKADLVLSNPNAGATTVGALLEGAQNNNNSFRNLLDGSKVNKQTTVNTGTTLYLKR